MLKKIVAVGGGGVGKSTYVIRFTQNIFVTEYDPTIENSYRKALIVEGNTQMLDILDTAGMEEYSAMRDQYFNVGQGFLCLYSVTSPDSLEEVQQIILQIKQIKDSENVPMVLIATKCDLERKVTRSKGEEVARSINCPYFEISAKTGSLEELELPISNLVLQINRYEEQQFHNPREPSRASKK